MNNIFLVSRRRKREKIAVEFPSATVVDTTSKAMEPWIKFSPFYPHGGIPVPFAPGYFSETVEGIWQGLKVFEKADVDSSKFIIKNMKGIKRTVRSLGKVIGHRQGIDGDVLLGYEEARVKIYIPSYKYILVNYLSKEIQALQSLLNKGDLVLLDYETNSDVSNLSKPLSHASLIARHLQGLL